MTRSKHSSNLVQEEIRKVGHTDYNKQSESKFPSPQELDQIEGYLCIRNEVIN